MVTARDFSSPERLASAMGLPEITSDQYHVEFEKFRQVRGYELYKGLLVRPNTWDHGVVAEQHGYDLLDIQDGDRVLDVGGNIGAFASYAISKSAALVMSYEPDMDNFDLLVLNTSMAIQGPKWMRNFYERCAIVGQDGLEEIELFMNEKGTNKALHSTVPIRGRPSVKVKARHFSDIPSIRRFNKIKIDIEGGEYDLGMLPFAYAEKVAIEWHFSRNAFIEAAKSLDEKIQKSGFTNLKPIANFNLRAHVSVYERVR